MSNSGNTTPLGSVNIPIIKNVMPTTIASQIVNVQPMMQNLGNVFKSTRGMFFPHDFYVDYTDTVFWHDVSTELIVEKALINEPLKISFISKKDRRNAYNHFVKVGLIVERKNKDYPEFINCEFEHDVQLISFPESNKENFPNDPDETKIVRIIRFKKGMNAFSYDSRIKNTEFRNKRFHKLVFKRH